MGVVVDEKEQMYKIEVAQIVSPRVQVRARSLHFPKFCYFVEHHVVAPRF